MKNVIKQETRERLTFAHGTGAFQLRQGCALTRSRSRFKSGSLSADAFVVNVVDNIAVEINQLLTTASSGSQKKTTSETFVGVQYAYAHEASQPTEARSESCLLLPPRWLICK
jgi:hypothetical protein